MHMFHKITAAAAMCLIAIIICAAFSHSDPTQPTVNLEALRSMYPYSNMNDTMGDYAPMPENITFDYVVEQCTLPGLCICRIRVLSDFRILTRNADIYEEDEFNQLMEDNIPQLLSFNSPIITAEIEDILWYGDCRITPGENVMISFGAETSIHGDHLDDVYHPGQSYLCVMQDLTGNNSVYNLDNLYKTNKKMTYYILNQDVLLSVTDDYYLDAQSGMTYAEYCSYFNETLEKLKD